MDATRTFFNKINQKIEISYKNNNWMKKTILDVIMKNEIGELYWMAIEPFYEAAVAEIDRDSYEIRALTAERMEKFQYWDESYVEYLPEYLKVLYTTASAEDRKVILAFKGNPGGYKNPVSVLVNHDVTGSLVRSFREHIRKEYSTDVDVKRLSPEKTQTLVRFWGEDLNLGAAQDALWEKLKKHQKKIKKLVNNTICNWWIGLCIKDKTRFSHFTNVTVSVQEPGTIVFHAFKRADIDQLLTFIEDYAAAGGLPSKDHSTLDELMWGGGGKSRKLG